MHIWKGLMAMAEKKNKHLELVFRVIETRANDWRGDDPSKKAEAEEFFCSTAYQYMTNLLGLGPFALPKGVTIDQDKMSQPENPPAEELLQGDFGRVEPEQPKRGFKTRLLKLIKNMYTGAI